MLLALLGLAAAQQAGDLELVRPTFTAGSLAWTGTPHGQGRGGLRAGVFTQYERDPLVLHEYGVEVGAVVRNRQVTVIGGSVQPHRHLAVYGTLPIVAQWNSEVPSYGTDGVHTGDVAAGVQVTGPGTHWLSTAARAELRAPTGRAEALAGDGAPRASLDALVGVGNRYVEWTSSVGATARRRTDEAVHYDAASELQASGALHIRPWPGRIEVAGGASTRASFQSLTKLQAIPGTEGLVSVRVMPRDHLQVDVGMGKGVGYGYGTSEWRVFSGVTWTRIPEPIAPPMTVLDEVLPEDLPELIVTRLPEPIDDETLELIWADGELARLDGDVIELRDELHFVYGTAELLPESEPILEQIRVILVEHPELTHVVIEGHASNEGSHRYNYNLSYARSRSVWEALVQAGVHPSRLSTRGMGEVQPKSGAIEADRRVEFHVVARGEATQVERPPLPWNGDRVE